MAKYIESESILNRIGRNRNHTSVLQRTGALKHRPPNHLISFRHLFSVPREQHCFLPCRRHHNSFQNEAPRLDDERVAKSAECRYATALQPTKLPTFLFPSFSRHLRHALPGGKHSTLFRNDEEKKERRNIGAGWSGTWPLSCYYRVYRCYRSYIIFGWRDALPPLPEQAEPCATATLSARYLAPLTSPANLLALQLFLARGEFCSIVHSLRITLILVERCALEKRTASLISAFDGITTSACTTHTIPNANGQRLFIPRATAARSPSAKRGRDMDAIRAGRQ